VDSFKRFARTAGPQEAQKALSAIGTLVRKMIRETDLPFRFGDSQFAIVFPETTADNATHGLERIRAAVEGQNLTVKNSQPHMPLTLSIGVSTLEKEYPNLEQFVSAADGALRKAVASGGNCIVVS
jgi:diguanylate cyclase